jgi:hypothetical protein
MDMALKLKVVDAQPLLRGAAHYWSVIMDMAAAQQPITIRAVHGLSSAPFNNVVTFFKSCEKAGVLERTADLDGRSAVYKALLIQSAPPRFNGNGSLVEGASRLQALWNAMRSPAFRAGFTIDDIVQWASTDEAKISVNYAGRYIKALGATGYLIADRKVWRLLPDMNTGPKAPKFMNMKIVYDFNSRRPINAVAVEEDADE